MSDLSTKLVQINRFEIRIRDFDRARVFYTEALGFDVWTDEDALPMLSDYRITWLKSGALCTYPTGYLIKECDDSVATLFIPGVPCWDGYPRVLFIDDLGDFSKRILSAGGEIYRPTRFRRHRNHKQLDPVTFQTFFQDTEGNVTELCTEVDIKTKSQSFLSHVSDSFASSQSSL